MKKYKAAKGTFWQNHIGEVGEWVDVSFLKYLYLKIMGYKVKQIDMIPELDEEWTKFLNNLTETSDPIKHSNQVFEKEKKMVC